jgi:hypothetical protein
MTGQIGPRGVAILVLVGVAGVFLALLGWSQRGTGLPAPHVGGLRAAVYIVESNPGHGSLVVTTAQARIMR